MSYTDLDENPNILVKIQRTTKSHNCRSYLLCTRRAAYLLQTVDNAVSHLPFPLKRTEVNTETKNDIITKINWS